MQKESIEKVLRFARYDQMKVWNSNLNPSNLNGSKVETNDVTGYGRSIWTCRKKINRLGITNQKIQVFQYDIESA